jgi:hypothetical protein
MSIHNTRGMILVEKVDQLSTEIAIFVILSLLDRATTAFKFIKIFKKE